MRGGLSANCHSEGLTLRLPRMGKRVTMPPIMREMGGGLDMVQGGKCCGCAVHAKLLGGGKAD